MQELKQYNNVYCYTYQRNGNDVNGNPIYLINIYEIKYRKLNPTPHSETEISYHNVNYLSDRRKDKHDNIIFKSYSIDTEIEYIIRQITK